MAATLTPNAVPTMVKNEMKGEVVVQVESIKKIPAKEESKPDRYKVAITDGTTRHSSTMLATQLNALVEKEELKANGIIRVTKSLCQDVSGRSIVIILACEVIEADHGFVIETKPTVTAPAPAAAAAAGGAAQTKKSPSNPYHGSSYASASSAHRGAAGSANVHPIDALQPFLNQWTIRGRVGNKGPIRTWSNPRGTGKLFSVDLIDESGEIRATGFNEQCDKFYDMLQVGKVYTIRGGKIKIANSRFNQLNNRYELSFSDATDIVEEADTGAIPQQKFTFKSFSQLEGIEVNRESNVFVDVIAIVTAVPDSEVITTRNTGKELTKRDITIKDRDSLTLQCTLWGEEAETFAEKGGEVGAVIAIKSARLSDFNGRSISVSSGSTMLLNPDIPEAHELKGWYDNEGVSTASKSITVKNSIRGPTPFIFISQIKDQGIGLEEGKVEYFEVKGTVTFLRKENCLYRACASPNCNKKVVEDAGKFRCEKCAMDHDTFKWRLMMSVCLSDATGQVWLTAFQETAEQMLAGTTAQELGEMFLDNPKGYDAALQSILFKDWKVRCRAKADTWQDQTRVRTSALNAAKLDYVEECKSMIESIKEYVTV